MWNLLKDPRLQKYKKNSRYIIRCDTCGQEFMDISVEEFLQLISEEKWHSSHPAYIEAGYHWIDNTDHLINANLRLDSGDEMHIFDLTTQWKQGLQIEPDQSKAAMKRELKWLEKRRTSDGKQRAE